MADGTDITMSFQFRTFFFLIGVLLWVGIALTGAETIHWLLYLPASFFLFAALTGICPGLIMVRKVFHIAEKVEPVDVSASQRQED